MIQARRGGLKRHTSRDPCRAAASGAPGGAQPLSDPPARNLNLIDRDWGYQRRDLWLSRRRRRSTPMGQFCSQQCVPGERFIGLGPPPPPPPHSELPRLPARLRIEYCASSNYAPSCAVKAKLESVFSLDDLRVIEAADISLQSSGKFEITLLNTNSLIYSTLGATSDEGPAQAPDGVEGARETQLVVQRPSRSGGPLRDRRGSGGNGRPAGSNGAFTSHSARTTELPHASRLASSSSAGVRQSRALSALGLRAR